MGQYPTSSAAFPSVALDNNTRNAEGATEYTFDSKTGPQNLGGANSAPNKFFDAPGPTGDPSPSLDGKADSSRQAVPTQNLTGSVPDPGESFTGQTLDWNSVAPIQTPLLGGAAKHKAAYASPVPD